MVVQLEGEVPDQLSSGDISDFLIAKHGPKGLDALQEIRSREISSGPMQPNCRVVVNMPVLNLEKNLYNALAQYSNQDLSKQGKEFVVALLINGPMGVDLESSEPYKAARKFMVDHPEVKVVIRTVNYPKETVNISRIRKDAAGLSLMEAAEVNGLDLDNLIQFTHDADLQKLAPDYLSKHVKVLDENPRLGAIAGFYDYPDADFHQDHLFLATQKFEDILTFISNSKSTNHILKGGATAFRTRDYIASGGIGDTKKMSELRPVYKGLMARDKESVLFSRQIGTVTTSARRQMMALGQNIPLSSAHDDFGKKGDLAERYQAPIGELQIPEVANKVTSPGFNEKLEKQLTSLYKKMRRMRERTEATVIIDLFKRAGFYAGIKLEIENEKIVIKDMSVLKKNILERYTNY